MWTLYTRNMVDSAPETAHPFPAPDPLRLPLLDDATAQLTEKQAHEAALLERKPKWRGWIHTGMFPVAIAAGVVLICLAHGALAKWASAIYMTSSLLLFGISALYHRINWRPNIKAVFRRLDHANIFLLIAGTYTPIALLALPLRTPAGGIGSGLVITIVVWSGALLGISFRVFWLRAPRWLYVPLYVALGWAAFMFIPDIARANLATMILVLVGGGLYTAGSIVYGLKRPNFVPGVFGFHELFHALTVLAFLCHWTAALLIALNPLYLR